VSEKRLVLHNTTYFDSVKGKMEEGKTIVLKNGLVDWIGDYSSFEKEENDELLNLEGKYVLPGLIDCHVHLDIITTLNPFKSYLTTQTFYYGYIALKQAQDHLRAGFTTLRDCGGEKWGSSLKRAIAAGFFKGPRLVVAQYGIAQYGNQDEMLPDELHDAFSKNKWFTIQSGIDGILHAVRDRMSIGSDFIKTATTGGILHGEKSKVDKSLFTEEELNAMTREAHRNGMHVASHAHGDEGIRLAVDCGVDTIEHGSMISEETADIMIKKRRHLVPTHLAYMDRHNPVTMAKIEPDAVKRLHQVVDVVMDCHKMAYEKGVKFALGTDSGVEGATHGTSAKELSLMVTEVGMSPTEALQCATITAAEAIQLDKDIGSIEVGKVGDVIVVSDNPLHDLTLLEDVKNIEYVIKDAVVVAEKGNLV
jgi:imidazolonepropionase-like amidohydrolase